MDGTMVDEAEAEGVALPAEVAGTEPASVDEAAAEVSPVSVEAAPVTGVGTVPVPTSVVAPEVTGVLGEPGVTEALVTATVVVDDGTLTALVLLDTTAVQPLGTTVSVMVTVAA